MRATLNLWIVIITASLVAGAAVAVGIGLSSMHPRTATTTNLDVPA